MPKQRYIPGAVERTELPVGFCLVYNDVNGVRGQPLRLSTDITIDPARVREHLFSSFEALCDAMDPTRVHRKRALQEKRAKLVGRDPSVADTVRVLTGRDADEQAR